LIAVAITDAIRLRTDIDGVGKVGPEVRIGNRGDRF